MISALKSGANKEKRIYFFKGFRSSCLKFVINTVDCKLLFLSVLVSFILFYDTYFFCIMLFHFPFFFFHFMFIITYIWIRQICVPWLSLSLIYHRSLTTMFSAEIQQTDFQSKMRGSKPCWILVEKSSYLSFETNTPEQQWIHTECLPL